MITLLFSLIFFISSAFSCEFNPKFKSYYSFSGAVTLAFKELSLLKSPALKGISVFHPISKNEFAGEFLPGGIFLSLQKVRSFSGSVIFFDESRELRNIFARIPDIKAVEIRTRNLLPLEASDKIQEELGPYLKNCSFTIYRKNLEKKMQRLKSLVPKDETYVFFLGHIRAGRYPELVMNQDGVVKWMIKEKLINSYPSELPYVNWSSLILQSLPVNTYRIGIKDSGSTMEKNIEKDNLKKNINLTFPGAMIPGVGQVDVMIYLFENLKN